MPLTTTFVLKDETKMAAKALDGIRKLFFPNELQQCCDNRVQALSKVGFSHK